MTDELTATEKNALKWVLFRDFYRDLSGTYHNAHDRYFKVDEFLKALGDNQD